MIRAALMALALVGCQPARDITGYSLELEYCLQTSNTCPEYVQCRAFVAKKYGRDFTGVCR